LGWAAREQSRHGALETETLGNVMCVVACAAAHRETSRPIRLAEILALLSLQLLFRQPDREQMIVYIVEHNLFSVVSSCTHNAEYYLFEYMNRIAEHCFSDGNNMIDKCPVTYTRFHLGDSVMLPQITFRTSRIYRM
jgi:hypothetical protein